MLTIPFYKANPYSFTVSENNNEIHATVQKTWINTMFIHVACFILLVFTQFALITVLSCDIGKFPERICCLLFVALEVLLGFLMAGMFITLLADWYVFKGIADEMQTLGKGGAASVDTKLSSSSAFTHPGMKLTLISNTIYFSF